MNQDVLRLFSKLCRRFSRPACRTALVLIALAGVSACGDDDPPTAPGNRAPAINVASNATFGIARVTTFSFSAATNDPDGNPVSVRWTFNDGVSAAGYHVWRVFDEPGTIEATATVTDLHGLSTASAVITVTVASITGEWAGTVDLASCEAGTKPVRASFVQTGATITGSLTLPEGLCGPTPGTVTFTAASPGQLFSNGASRLRVVIPEAGIDATFQGQMSSDGLQITGTVQDMEPAGMAFTLDRQ